MAGPPGNDLAALASLFAALGYAPCGGDDVEAGHEKVALYADDQGSWTRAARQLPNGSWTSTLGPDDDILHRAPQALIGALYGQVEAIMKRSTPTPSGGNVSAALSTKSSSTLRRSGTSATPTKGRTRSLRIWRRSMAKARSSSSNGPADEHDVEHCPQGIDIGGRPGLVGESAGLLCSRQARWRAPLPQKAW